MAEAPEKIPAWAERFVRLLDDGFRIPGTEWRIGLDGIIGLLFPAFGDGLSAVSSLSLFYLAYQRRLPYRVLLRMALNIGLDALIGALPVLGDLFDFAWKANRKNLALIERASRDDARRTRGSSLREGLLVGAIVLVLVSLLVLPLVLSFWLLSKLLHSMSN
jgi:hypothetical protein